MVSCYNWGSDLMSNIFDTSTIPYSKLGAIELQRLRSPVWVNANIDGTSDVSYNVSSISDTGTGTIGISFSITFVDTNYVFMGFRQANASGTYLVVYQDTANLSTIRSDFQCNTATPTATDPNEWDISFIGNTVA